MILKECIMTLSRCYRETSSDPKVGIIVHSTGVNNTSLKRYVQPTEGTINYSAIIADIGKNYNKNDWNHTDVAKGVHAFIGKNKAGQVEVDQVLPYEKNAWGVAAGPNGSVNYGEHACIQFEVQEDNLKSKSYFTTAITNAIEYCASLCKKFGWDESVIWSHKEAIAKGWGAGTRVDIDYWLGKYGKNMDWFRAEVKKLLQSDEIRVGDKVRLTSDATVWNSTKRFSSWVYESDLYVLKLKGDRAWFSIYQTGPTTGTTDKKYLVKVE